MISYAVIAAQHGGSDQPEKFLVLGTERAGLVGLVVESEEALDAEVAAAEDFLVQVGAKLLKILQAIGHGSSGGEPSRYYGPTRATLLGHVTGTAQHFPGERSRHFAMVDDGHAVDQHVFHALGQLVGIVEGG